MAKLVKKRKTVQQPGLKINFDIAMLNAIIKFIRCEFVSRVSLSNLQKLMNSLDMTTYNYSPEIKDRITLIKLLCEAVIDNNIKDDSVLELFLSERDKDMYDLAINLGIEKNTLTSSECKVIENAINEKLQCMYIYEMKDGIIDDLSEFDKTGFTSYYDVIKSLKSKLSNLMVKLQDISAPDTLIKQFNFSGPMYKATLEKIHEIVNRPTNILYSGIRQLNAILNPGFECGRLYCFLGGTGKFKSGTLWNIVDQMRRYNPQVVPVENGMRKTILFVTMENTITETIVRLFDMYNTSDKSFADCTPDEIEQILKENGKFIFTDTEGIDIELRYYGDLEIATSHLYTVIEELKDQGKEVISVVLDYILKIESTRDSHDEERLRIAYAAKELKMLAQNYNIPVITAMQTNREGNGIIEAGMRDNKEDLAKFVGMAHIGASWGLAQECDVMILINLEMQKSSGRNFLTMNMLKNRGKSDTSTVKYFNHPFVANTMRLVPDVELDKPVSIISLATDLVGIDESKKSINNSPQNRPTIATVASANRNGDILESIDISGLASVA